MTMTNTTTSSAEAFRKNLRDGINELGISDSEFARRADMPVQLLWKYLKGTCKPGVDQLDRFADVLDITASELISPPE